MFMLIISIILLTISVIGFYITNKTEIVGFVVVPTFITCFWFLFFVIVGTLVVYIEHIYNVESIQYKEEVIQIEQERLNSLYDKLESFQYDPASISMWNEDTPVHITTKAIETSENRIALARTQKEYYKRKIRQREHWIYSWIVNLVPPNYEI